MRHLNRVQPPQALIRHNNVTTLTRIWSWLFYTRRFLPPCKNGTLFSSSPFLSSPSFPNPSPMLLDSAPDLISACLVVGNYCHDVLHRDGLVIGETLGGAASFISNVLDSLSPSPTRYVSKVGTDFAYSVSHPPLISASSPTTLFHAHFPDSISETGYHGDRVLKRVRVCDPIYPSDLLELKERFEIGLAAGVAGEIPIETLERMIELCRVVFVDVQGLIRSFDPEDGTVGLRKHANFVAHIEDGCRVYWKDGELHVAPFPANQVDPTGAGDSFFGGLVVGLLWGLTVPDAALLGNLLGSVTVGQVGVPQFDPVMLENLKQVLDSMAAPRKGSDANDALFKFQKSSRHDEFQASLQEIVKLKTCFELSNGDVDKCGNCCDIEN
ncbi:Inositol 3-kinase [Rhynchospora pubera]|uniref:Inositol 3-kinase n=1 Tax=Rhynchospora pubera TaxID=906938 RepID=A0AAV8HHD8_9POAL|nr:Inositol 3-kinase [Rhynchospora pubera]